MLQIFSLILTCILTVYMIFSRSKHGKIKACVMGTGFFAVAFYLDSIFLLIMKGFAESGGMLVSVVGIIASKSILAAVLIFLKVAEMEPNKRAEGWQYIDGLTIGISALLIMLAVWCQLRENSVIHCIVFLMVLLVFFTVYCISVFLYNKNQCIRRMQEEDDRRKHESSIYIESVENNYQRTRELWHDLKNHINLLQVLMKDQKYEELSDYLRIFSEDVDTLTLPMKSGNMIVDALLSDKLGRAKREGVAVTLSLCDLTGLKLKADEICGLLGNLLDNALEANRQVSNEKFLEVTCKEQEECYYIRVRNASVGGTYDNESGLPKTVKIDRKNQVGHGLGLRSIERIVHGCGGELVVESKGEIFTVVVRLPG